MPGVRGAPEWPCAHPHKGSRRGAWQAHEIIQQLRRGITSHCVKTCPSIHTSPLLPAAKTRPPNWVLGAETAVLFTPEAPYSWGFTTLRRLNPVSWSQETAGTLKITEKKNAPSPVSYTRASVRPERLPPQPFLFRSLPSSSRLITDTDA